MGFSAFSSLIIIAVVAILIWQVVRTVRYGSFSGALFGARSADRIGELEGKALGHRRVTVAVHRLEDGGPQRVLGLYFTGRAFASVSRMAASVSREDGLELAELLERAAAEREGS